MTTTTQLLHQLTAIFTDYLPESGEGESDLHRAIASLNQAGTPQSITPRVPSVVEQWLERCCAQPCDPRHQACVDALAAIGKSLHWFTPPVDYAGETLAENFSFVRLIGPPLFGVDSPFDSDSISAGFTIQAPHTFYPSHWHPAVEFYGVLSGIGRWQIDDTPFVEKPPGSFIYHPSNAPHAMETNAEPMLAVYSWVGEIDTRPVAE